MTDDKGAGEGPYYVECHPGTRHWEEWDVKCSDRFVSSHCNEYQAHKVCADLNTAHAEGRKTERERCAKIAEDHALLLNSPGEAAACREVAEMIRGGQDGE